PPTNHKANGPTTVKSAKYNIVPKPRRDAAYLNTPKVISPESNAVASTKVPNPWNCALEVTSRAKPPASTAVAAISGRGSRQTIPKIEETMRTNARSPAPKPTVRGKVIRATTVKDNQCDALITEQPVAALIFKAHNRSIYAFTRVDGDGGRSNITIND